MPNVVTRAIAAIRQQPALAVAVGGVGLAAAVSVGRRRAEDDAPPTEAAVAVGALPPIGGYGAGLTQPLPGPAYQYSDEQARGFAALQNAIAAQSAAVVAAIEAQARRAVTLPAPPTPPNRPKPAPAPGLPADLGTIVIGLRSRYPNHYKAWLAYAGAGGRQTADESRAERTARLRRELAFYTARIAGG